MYVGIYIRICYGLKVERGNNARWLCSDFVGSVCCSAYKLFSTRCIGIKAGQSYWSLVFAQS